MCGIAGCYQQPDGYKLADIMTDRIAHRGPDAGGVWTHEDDRVSVNLGHRRLSIIDLSAAADQPMEVPRHVRVRAGRHADRRAVPGP
jgi:asparagine synthase (glutamine-hydrolysing)